MINPESGAVEQQTPWTRMVTHCLLIDAATFAFLVHLPWIDKRFELIGKLFFNIRGNRNGAATPVWGTRDDL